MNQSLLPPRGIFIPTHMIYNTQLPPAVLVTWIKLRSLAWKGWVTPPLNLAELASLVDIHPTRFHKHLSQLLDISALSCRSTQAGKLILSFPEEPTSGTDNQASASIHPGSTVLNSQDRESLDPTSYFPPRILGYLSYQEDPEGCTNNQGSHVHPHIKRDHPGDGIPIPPNQPFDFSTQALLNKKQALQPAMMDILERRRRDLNP
jgi:hypothetical protein